MPTIEIFDFSGGLNTTDSQLMAEANQCTSGSINVWAFSRALTKTPGYSILQTITSSGRSVYTGGNALFHNASISTGQTHYVFLVSTGASDNYQYPWITTTAGLSQLQGIGYSTGTVSIAGAGRISATGTGTSWDKHVMANDLFTFSVEKFYRVSSVEDATHLTLAAGVSADVTNVSYNIMPRSPITRTFAVLNNLLCVSSPSTTNGVVAAGYPILISVTGSTRATAADTGMQYLQTHKSYLFAAPASANKSRMAWSNIKDPSAWTATNFIDVDKDNGQVVGLFSLGNELIVFKSRSMYKVLGEIFDSSNPTFSVQPIAVPNDFLNPSNNSCAIHNGTLIFTADSGVYSYSPGASRIGLISFPIKYTLETGASYFGTSFNGYYIIKGSGKQFVLDGNGAWWDCADSTALSGGLDMFGDVNYIITTGSSGNQLLSGRVYAEFDAATGANAFWQIDFNAKSPVDNYVEASANTSVAIESMWFSKEFNIGYGHVRDLEVYLKKQSAGNLNIGWFIDQAAIVTADIDMTVGRGNMIRAVIPINQIGSTVQFRVLQNGNDQTFELYGLRCHYDTDIENRRR